MAYKIKRTAKIVETLELCGDNGEVVKSLPITVDVEAIAGELRRRLTAVTTAEKQLKKAVGDKDYNEAYELYGQTVTDVFSACFGKQNTADIVEFYDGNFVEMSLALVPFIYDVILPAANDVVKQRKAALKSIYKRR